MIYFLEQLHSADHAVQPIRNAARLLPLCFEYQALPTWWSIIINHLRCGQPARVSMIVGAPFRPFYQWTVTTVRFKPVQQQIGPIQSTAEMSRSRCQRSHLIMETNSICFLFVWLSSSWNVPDPFKSKTTETFIRTLVAHATQWWWRLACGFVIPGNGSCSITNDGDKGMPDRYELGLATPG